MDIKRKSLISALSEYNLKDLPAVDDGQSVWVKALALVNKRDGTHSYVCVKKDADTLENKIAKDFGTCSTVISYLEFYPFSFLKSGYMPIFKGQKKEDRVKYLSKYNPHKDYSEYTLKELEREIIAVAIRKQLNEETYG